MDMVAARALECSRIVLVCRAMGTLVYHMVVELVFRFWHGQITLDEPWPHQGMLKSCCKAFEPSTHVAAARVAAPPRPLVNVNANKQVDCEMQQLARLVIPGVGMRDSGPRAREGADGLGMLSTRGSGSCKRGLRSILRVDVVHSSRTLLERRESRVQEAAERQKRDGRSRGKLDWLIRSEEEARRVRVTELPFLLSHVVTLFW